MTDTVLNYTRGRPVDDLDITRPECAYPVQAVHIDRAMWHTSSTLTDISKTMGVSYASARFYRLGERKAPEEAMQRLYNEHPALYEELPTTSAAPAGRVKNMAYALKRVLESKQWSHRELAEHMAVSTGYISMCVTGRRAPSETALENLRDNTGINMLPFVRARQTSRKPVDVPAERPAAQSKATKAKYKGVQLTELRETKISGRFVASVFMDREQVDDVYDALKPFFG